ncbi:hypothetical protein [Antrihabitans cavernicola]|uniref:Transmembrane protein n=1 Tax=Antrihabitans cavernicola TaxID=2495913 RepID=A0A5A7SDQ4_9NOCA|nr:hypothetical protein [Spelaeibacter cavernicola]KAA0024288.1 hypothetical protein FOY51_07075 [Spelaeibacter cavernicola]
MATAPEIYAQYITARKSAELDSRKRVEERGAAIVTTSSSLLTLIFVITVLITGKEKDAAKFVSQAAVVVLFVALGAFVISAVIGIYVQNAAWRYQEVSDRTLRSIVAHNAIWNGSADEAIRICADREVVAIESLRRGTQKKAWISLIALGIQGLAILLLAISLFLEFKCRGSF